ncbi:MAG: LysM peptidoglycan-binding domain-containing protein [Frankiales bacterium]|nr:LysM peptidoglycan-binding domain-containing protein [Frankiales bacterium]
MTRTTRRRPGRTTLGVLMALAVVVTAGAPAVITVRSGDTLWDLARSHDTTVAALRRLNDLPGNAELYAGDTLRIGTGSSAQAGTYLVRRGDTLSEIAQRFGTTSAAIRRANAMRSSTVYAGQRLRLPGAASTTPTTNAGKRIPESVRASVARHRAILAARSHPSKASVRRMVAATARRHGVSPSLAVAVAFHESGFQQRVVSPVDAIGVMQVLPRTGSELGRQHGRTLDLLNTQDNITAGVLLLRQLVRATGTTDRALAGYYQGAGSIARQGILPQTRSYIRSITVLRKRFPNG